VAENPETIKVCLFVCSLEWSSMACAMRWPAQYKSGGKLIKRIPFHQAPLHSTSQNIAPTHHRTENMKVYAILFACLLAYLFCAPTAIAQDANATSNVVKATGTGTQAR
jgi:hypothetical protein